MNIKNKIEAILLFKNEPVSYKDLSKILEDSIGNIRGLVKEMIEEYKDRGIVVLEDGDVVSLGTNPELSGLIETMQKDELNREIGRAGLETLAIIVYKGPVSRREIDYIRGVNSGFILRNLLVRGLIERAESGEGERSFSYKPTLDLLRHLGVKSKEELPEYGSALRKLTDFIQDGSNNVNE